MILFTVTVRCRVDDLKVNVSSFFTVNWQEITINECWYWRFYATILRTNIVMELKEGTNKNQTLIQVICHLSPTIRTIPIMNKLGNMVQMTVRCSGRKQINIHHSISCWNLQLLDICLERNHIRYKSSWSGRRATSLEQEVLGRFSLSPKAAII